VAFSACLCLTGVHGLSHSLLQRLRKRILFEPSSITRQPWRPSWTASWSFWEPADEGDEGDEGYHEGEGIDDDDGEYQEEPGDEDNKEEGVEEELAQQGDELQPLSIQGGRQVKCSGCGSLCLPGDGWLRHLRGRMHASS
jgi:hypothetical protein